jgi:polyisoprenoid-binding protein YceI
MKSIKHLFTVAAAAAVLTSCGDQAPATEEVETNEETQTEATFDGQYMVDQGESVVNWEGTMLEVGGVSLYGHHGRVNVAKGEVMLENGTITSGVIVIDMTTIKPQDDNFEDKEGKTAGDLVGHLSSDDFFNVGEHPTASLNITGMKDNVLMGEMTIRGNTNPVKIEGVEIKEDENGMMHASGKFDIDRQAYGARFSMPVQEKVLSDKIQLSFEVKAKKVNA